MKLLEAVPNVSEGRDPARIEALAGVIRNTKGVKLLHSDSGYAANRTVFTYVGEPEAVLEASLHLYAKAFELIDMREHRGVHPRLGAVDVCPLIPLQGMEINEAINYATRLAEQLSEQLPLGGYFYACNACFPERIPLSFLRKGGYESLPAKLSNLSLDFGIDKEWQRFGLTTIGARHLMLAFNINLNTDDALVAQRIAARIRESGRLTTTGGRTQRMAGRLGGVKAIGWHIDEFKRAQVSCNLMDLQQNSLLEVFLATAEEAEALGYQVTGSELVGMTPKAELLKAGRYFAPKAEQEEEQIEAAIKGLNLNELKTFEPSHQIIEYALTRD